MMENGLHRFYYSLNDFLEKHRAQAFLRHDQKDSCVLTAGDLRGPLILCTYLLISASSIFLFEKIVYKRRRVNVDVDWSLIRFFFRFVW